MTALLARSKARWAAFMRWLYEEPQNVVQYRPARSDYRLSKQYVDPNHRHR